MNAKTGKELALSAMKKEHRLLTKQVEKAKAEVKEYENAVEEFIAISEEWLAAHESKETGKGLLKKLDELDQRRKRVSAVNKKDYIMLLDKKDKAETERDNLAEEIRYMEFYVRQQQGVEL